MHNKKPYVLTRWSIPFAGFLVALMGGFSYAWGVFIVPLSEKYDWSTAEASLPFTAYILFLAFVMVPAGKLQDQFGPKKISIIGSILFFIAYGLASLVSYFPSPWWLIMTYGVLGGTASALTYACAAPTARKWFPDKPGFAISVAVMGVGLAALFVAPLKADFLLPELGIEKTLLFMGILSSVVCLFASWLFRDPPVEWKPEGWVPGKAKNKTSEIRREATPMEVLKSPVFYTMWFSFFLVVAGGMMCIGLLPAFGEKILGLTPISASIAISIFAGFNGLGRPFAGYLSDRFGVVWVMIFTYSVQAVAFLGFHLFATTAATLYISSAIFGWGVAVTLAVFPTLTAICFGTKNLGVNYGLVITALGIGAIAPAIGSWIFDLTGSYTPTFFSAGVMSVIGVALSIVLKKKYLLS
ncbi:MAG: OFA family MFS transporter [Alkaliphilus sp.]